MKSKTPVRSPRAKPRAAPTKASFNPSQAAKDQRAVRRSKRLEDTHTNPTPVIPIEAPNATVTAAPRGRRLEQILALLARSDGVTIAEMQETLGWQAHSVRGFLSGVIRKRQDLTLESLKPSDGPRRYWVKPKHMSEASRS